MAGPIGGAGPALLGGRYRLDDRIGAGGMGEVWRATDVLLGRTVAVKSILPALMSEPGFARRFLVEAQAMAGVSHPGVVAIHDYHSDASGAYLVMQYVHGESLAQMLGRVRRLSPQATMDVVAQVASALQAVHAQGIVHRDIKPANILMRPDGTVMLTDFGIARTDGGTSLTSAGAVLGTPSYLAPEQVMGQPATARSDVYALGLVAYECLAGHRPFEGDNPYAIALQRLHQAPQTLVSDAPRGVLEVMEHALAMDPARRWSTAADMAAAARATYPAGQSGAGPAHMPMLPGAIPAYPPMPSGVVPAYNPTPSGAVPVRTPHPTTAHPQDASQWGAWQPPQGPVSPPAKPRQRLRVVAIAVVVVLLAAGAAYLGADIATGKGPSASGATGSTNPAASGRSTGNTVGHSVPAGYRACTGGYCPVTPMCWHGLFIASGVASQPEAVGCNKAHFWQTFVVAYLPAADIHVPQDQLMKHAEIANVCSAAALARASHDPAHTNGWNREPVPLRLDDGTWILQCMTGTVGETTGSVT